MEQEHRRHDVSPLAAVARPHKLQWSEAPEAAGAGEHELTKMLAVPMWTQKDLAEYGPEENCEPSPKEACRDWIRTEGILSRFIVGL